MLEQLLYGWSRRGLEGSNRLQLVATTPGWATDSAHRRLALKLCTFETVRSKAALAYGYVDVSGTRFVFNRRMVPSLAGSAPGLVAHVVSGPPEELPVTAIIAAFGSGSWWSGDPVDENTLQSGGLVDFAAAAPETPTLPFGSDLSAVVANILHGHQAQSMVLEQEPHDVIAILGAIHRRVPSLLEVLNFSTYESANTLAWFDIAGTGRDPVPAGAYRLALNGHPRGDCYGEEGLAQLEYMVSTMCTEPFADLSHAAKRELLGVCASLVEDGQPADLTTLASNPSTVALLMSVEFGILAIVDSVWSVSCPRWSAAPRESRLEQAAVHLGRHSAFEMPAETVVEPGTVLARLESISPTAARAFIEALADRIVAGQPCLPPDPDITLRLLQWSATTRDHVAARAVRTYCEPALGWHVLRHRDLPESVRQWSLGVAVANGIVSGQDCSLLFERFPRLFTDDRWLRNLESRRLVELLGEAKAGLQEHMLAQIVYACAPPRAVAVGEGLIDAGATVLGLRLLSGVRLAAGRGAGVAMPTPVRITAMLTNGAREAMRGDTELDPLRDLPWWMCEWLDDRNSWLTQLGRICRRGHQGPLVFHPAPWLSVLEVCPDTQRGWVMRLGLFVLGQDSDTFTNASDFLALMGSHKWMHDDQVVDLLLRGIASRQARGHPPAVGSLLLAIDLAVKQRGVSRRPTVNPKLETRLVRAVRALDERALRRLQMQSTNLSKAALTWLGL